MTGGDGRLLLVAFYHQLVVLLYYHADHKLRGLTELYVMRMRVYAYIAQSGTVGASRSLETFAQVCLVSTQCE